MYPATGRIMNPVLPLLQNRMMSLRINRRRTLSKAFHSRHFVNSDPFRFHQFQLKGLKHSDSRSIRSEWNSV